MTNVLPLDQHPRIKIGTVQNDLNMLSNYIEEEIEKDLTSDELYVMLGTLKAELDMLKEY